MPLDWAVVWLNLPGTPVLVFAAFFEVGLDFKGAYNERLSQMKSLISSLGVRAPPQGAASQPAELGVQHSSWTSTLEVFHGDRAERGNLDDGISEDDHLRVFLDRGMGPRSTVKMAFRVNAAQKPDDVLHGDVVVWWSALGSLIMSSKFFVNFRRGGPQLGPQIARRDSTPPQQ